MAKGSENPFPSVLFAEGSVPATPATGFWRAYFKTTGLYVIDDAGTEYGVQAGPQTIIVQNTQTASYTLVLGDAGKSVEMDAATANDLTVPPNSTVAFPVGTVIEVCQIGAGQTTVVAGSGVTVQTPETLVLTGQWSTVSLRKRATDEWVLVGDVEAA